MDKRTLTALKKSIKHWERIAAGRDKKIGASHCALCQIFNGYPLWCHGCPVGEKTGERLCSGSPYVKVEDLYLSNGNRVDISIPAVAKAVARELKFLRSLLPKEK